MTCRLCGALLEESESYSVCDVCGMQIARRYRDRLLHEERAKEREHDDKARAAAADRARREAASRPPIAKAPKQLESVVYYVRLGAHIKIGYSSNLVTRLHALRAEPADVLAVEPGGQVREAARHREFAHLRIKAKWENFTIAPDLEQHIANLRDEHGIPAWLTPPRRPHNRSRATPVTIRMVGDP